MIQTVTGALTWDDVLLRDDLVGGDIEYVEHGTAYRGPLGTIEVVEEIVRFTSPWRARLNSCMWEKWNETPISVAREVPPKDIGQGMVHFLIPRISYGTIIPKGGSKLQPTSVTGLEPGWRRLLALYPELDFDRATADGVLRERRFNEQIQDLEELSTEATLEKLLDRFTTDNSREDFLTHYVEAASGNSVMCCPTY